MSELTFLEQPLDVSNVQVYQPFPPSRQGEWVAWGCTAAMLLVVFLRWRTLGEAGFGAWVLSSLFFCSALLIRFGHWMTTHTFIAVEEGRIRFSNPLRQVEAPWGALEKLCFEPRAGAWRVSVKTAVGEFYFDTPSILGATTSRPTETGYKQGERLAAVIWQKGGLSRPEAVGAGWCCRRRSVRDA